MDPESLKFIGGGGTLGTIIFFAIKYGVKAIEKLYDDMKAQHKQQMAEALKREYRLMKYLDEKNCTDSKVAETLSVIHERLCEVECIVKKESDSDVKKNLS
jgi:hypothetical protein